MQNRSAKLPAGLCLVLAIGASAAAMAAEPSGTAIAVVQATEAAGDAGSRILVTTGPVYMGDTIRTGARGEAQIRLADNTRLVVGPNSSMVVDAFVFSGGGTAKAVSLNALRGTFRFITGASRKSAYTITTPTATIGVRGTEFDFSVDGRGQVNFALFSGQARICSRAGRCTVLSGACSVAVVPRTGAVERLPAGSARTTLLGTAFPYVASQQRLNRAFRVDTSSCGVRRANLLPGDRAAPGVFERRSAISAPSGGGPGPGVDPGEITGSIRNRNGFADNTNPGRGDENNNAPGGGTDNPGGTSSGNGGGGDSGGGGGNGGGGNGSHGNGNANGHSG